jgi:hypothetical protein
MSTLTPEQLAIEERILRAFKTLRAMPDPDARFRVLHNYWPDMVRDVADAYGYNDATLPRFRPTPVDVGDYLTALSWLKDLEPREIKLVEWVSMDFGFSLIGARIGRSYDTAKRRYEDAIRKIWRVTRSRVAIP